MKKTLFTLVISALVLNGYTQGLQVNPPSATTNKIVQVPHVPYPSNFLFNEPGIVSIDLNASGEKILILDETNENKTLGILDLQSGKKNLIQASHLSKAKSAKLINDSYLALQVELESSIFEIIEISTGKVVESIIATDFIGALNNLVLFSNKTSSSASIEQFDLSTKKSTRAGNVPGEVLGWYFSESKGLVGVAVHSNMKSMVYVLDNFKIGKSLFEFSSGYYFETKGCNSAGDVFYGITNFQSLSTYACAISSTGIKPLNNKSGESCTDFFMHSNDLALSSFNINAAEYQESNEAIIQKILAFAKESFKGSSVKVLEYASKNSIVLFSLQSEVIKPHYFVWKNNQAKPISTDIYDGKNLSFIGSEIVQIQTGEVTPQSGRMYLPSRESKSSYPLVIYFDENIFLPYPNKFNPTVQGLCQNGYAVFVWNSRFCFRPKIGFAYSDLVATFPEDLSLLLEYLKKEYNLIAENTFVVGEGLGGYLALNASALGNEHLNGVVINKLNFPGKEYTQDVTAVRMFGEDAQSKWNTLEKTTLSEKTNYLSYSSQKSNIELRFFNSMKQNQIKWTDRPSESIHSLSTPKELDGILNWMQHLSQIQTQVFEDKPKVDVKKK